MGEFFKRYWKSNRNKAGTIMLLVVFGFAFIGPFFTSVDPFDMAGMMYERPSSQYWLGTDNFGRDVFVDLMYGTRTSIIVGFMAGVIATLIGTVIGSYAGYFGGRIDGILSSITNLFLVIPPFVILILLSISLDSRSIFLLSLIIGVTSWPWVARSVRSQVSSLRSREHVNIARISGFSTMEIIISEIIPYILSYVFMAFILQVSIGIINEATLSMLGLGAFNTISLGEMMNWALMYESVRSGVWWAFIPPVIMIALITFSLKFINTGMDEIFNPKLRN